MSILLKTQRNPQRIYAQTENAFIFIIHGTMRLEPFLISVQNGSMKRHIKDMKNIVVKNIFKKYIQYKHEVQCLNINMYCTKFKMSLQRER